jgi:hypothetical protein
MPNLSREEQLRAYAGSTLQKLLHAGETLAGRQSTSGAQRGNVPPWPGSEDADLHGTLQAAWVWSRAMALGETQAYAANVNAAWTFVRGIWPRLVPSALGSSSGDESPYDCAMVLRAALGDKEGTARAEAKPLCDAAARLLGAYLTDLEDLGGRDFADPGFLVWNLAEYARASNDRGLLATARRFVDRAFGMKTPPPFESEHATTEGLFDFSSTTATRVLAILAAEGATPFTGAWLRERVGPSAPAAFVERPMDENSWNACVAVALGRAFVVSTDPVFLRAHQVLVGELDARAGALSGALGRQAGFEDETTPTFYYAMALDSLLKG